MTSNVVFTAIFQLLYGFMQHRQVYVIRQYVLSSASHKSRVTNLDIFLAHRWIITILPTTRRSNRSTLSTTTTGIRTMAQFSFTPATKEGLRPLQKTRYISYFCLSFFVALVIFYLVDIFNPFELLSK